MTVQERFIDSAPLRWRELVRGRRATRCLVAVELTLVTGSLMLVSQTHHVRMQTDGVRVTAPIVQIEVEGDDNIRSQWVTVYDERTESDLRAEMAGTGRRIGDVVTVIVDPKIPSVALDARSSYRGAMLMIVVTMVCLVWPVVWFASRRYWSAPLGQPVPVSAASGVLAIEALAAAVTLLVAPTSGSRHHIEVWTLFGDLRWALLPGVLGIASLSFNRSWHRPNWCWLVATMSLILTFAGVLLWTLERV